MDNTRAVGPFSLTVVTLDETRSTNEYACRLGERGTKEIVAVRARCQTHGKGRRGRRWVSIKDKGIYASFLLRPHRNPHELGLLGTAFALAAVRTIRDIVPASIKWPNDIIFGNMKLGGVLPEAHTSSANKPFIIVGIGLNINNTKDELLPNAVSLALITGKTYDIKKLFTRLLREVIIVYGMFMKKKKRLCEQISPCLVTLGKKVQVRTNTGRFQASALALDISGALVVKDTQGKKRMITASELVHLRSAQENRSTG